MKKIAALLVLVIVLAVAAMPLHSTDSVSAQGSDGPADKWCSGVKIVFFPGGPAGGVFAVNVYNGAVQAAADLGADVEYVWSDWDPQKMIQQFSEADGHQARRHRRHGSPRRRRLRAAGRRGRGPGHHRHQPEHRPAAASKASTRATGFGYVGQELYAAGYNLGKEAVRRFGLVEGDRAMVWGLLSQPTRGLRTQGVIDAFEEAGLMVDYLEIDAATNADPPAGIPTFVGYVSSNPDVKLVVTDHGGLTATLQTYLDGGGQGPG